MAMRGFTSKVPIHKGWSGDKKYCVTDKQGSRYLLRISPIEQYDRKAQEFSRMQQVADLGIPMCLPLAFGICEEGVYSLQSWIDGEDAEAVLPFLPEQAQYAYGLEAGRILRSIHTIPAPENGEPWEQWYSRKLDRKIQAYEACPLQYENGQIFLNFIQENRHLLRGRPQVFQHGDYHRGNMMIGQNKTLFIIDFDREDVGDPWEEMKAITWDAQISPWFASGRIDGYFDGKIPEEFWRLLALYICCGVISALPWAIPFGEKEIATMRQQAAEVLSWYNNLEQIVPNWYQKG